MLIGGKGPRVEEIISESMRPGTIYNVRRNVWHGILLGSLLVLRAYMGWLGMPGRNPLAQFTLALTQWIVGPISRLLPRREERIELPLE